MGYRRTPFAPNEWYHCFSRGIDGRTIFETEDDFQRYEELLYLANDTKPVDRAAIRTLSHEEIFGLPRKESLVSIGARCLMNNHPHLLLKEEVEGGISSFMQKIGTGYTMYFNIKRERIGNLLVGPFRSKHITDDRYLRRVVQYIHLNPAEIFEPDWKKGIVRNKEILEKKLRDYKHSSLPDYLDELRPQRAILDEEAIDFLSDDLPSLGEVLHDAGAYYAELADEYGTKNQRRRL